MKQKFLLKTMLLLCALIVGGANFSPVWATDTDVTFTAGTDKSAATSLTKSDITLSVTSGTFNRDDNYRVYANNTLTVSSSSGNISKIVFTYDQNTLTLKSGEAGSITSGTWTGDATSVTFNTSGGQVRLSKVVVTYASGGGSTVSTPTFSPSAGAVAYNTSVSISCATDGATIYYTTNGDNPTTSSTEYDPEDKPTITGTTTIKAIAVKDGLTNSSVGSASYTIKAPDAPVFSVAGGMVEKGSTVTLSSAEGTTIRYTTDGSTTPTASVGTVYSSAITINTDQTIKAVAYDAGGNCSSVTSYAFTVFNGTVVTFDASSDTGTSLSKNGVSFTTSATESSVYKWYKTNNTTFAVLNGKIKRIELTGVSGYAISNMTAAAGTLTTSDSPNGVWTGSVTSVKFTASTAQARASKVKVFYVTTATPTFSVATGEYSAAQSVTLSCATVGASIYYTTDGSTPTSSSTAYSSAISITETTTLKAIAIYDGVESTVASATYTMNRPAAPTFDVATCVFDAAFDLHLSAADGTTIYYTTDGSTPTTSSSVYSTKVAISAATTTVKAIAVKDGLTSDVASASYTYDSRTTPTFTLSTTSIDLKVNDTSSAVTLTTNSDATPSFSCEDAHVTLTGTGNSRTISANAAGTYTVNVSVSGSATYKDAAGTITVTVTKKATTMVLTPSFTSKDLYVTKAGSLTGAPQYNSSDIAGAEVTYSSSDTKVATIAADGAITFKKAGTTTITVSYEGDDEYEECEETYVLDLTDSTPQETEVDITFGNTLYGTSYSGAGAAGNGPFEGSVSNLDVTVAQGSGSNLYVTDSETRIYGGVTKGTITITAPTGYLIIKIVFNNGTAPSKWDISASPGSLSTATWTGSASSVVFSASGRSDFTTATVTLAPTVTVTASGYLSYCSPYKLDFSGTEVKAYKAAVDGEGKVTLTQVDVVPANTGVVLYSAEAKDANEAKTYTILVTDKTASDITGNQMVGVLSRTPVEWNPSSGVYNYILQSGVFKKASDGYLKANRAYLSTSYDVTAAGARELQIVFDDNTTGINSLTPALSEGEGAVYDLQGRKVTQPKKGGLYIVNGKKVVI